MKKTLTLVTAFLVSLFLFTPNTKASESCTSVTLNNSWSDSYDTSWGCNGNGWPYCQSNWSSNGSELFVTRGNQLWPYGPAFGATSKVINVGGIQPSANYKIRVEMAVRSITEMRNTYFPSYPLPNRYETGVWYKLPSTPGADGTSASGLDKSYSGGPGGFGPVKIFKRNTAVACQWSGGDGQWDNNNSWTTYETPIFTTGGGDTMVAIGVKNVEASDGCNGETYLVPDTSIRNLQICRQITNQPPSLSNVTISNSTVKADNSTPYTITVSANDADAAADIYGLYGLINYQGENAGNHRGYLTWGLPNYWPSSQDWHACSGGGYAVVQSGYGNSYIHLDSCSISNSGNNRTVSFVVRFDPSFTTPLIDNDISGYAFDSLGQPNGWTNFQTNFNLEPPCTGSTPSNLAGSSSIDPTDSLSAIISWSLPDITSWGTKCPPPNNNQYQIYVDTVSPPLTLYGSNPIVTNSLSGTRTFTGTGGVTYYWKVEASNNGGATYGLPAIGSFTLTTSVASWFQVVGGDVVAAAGNITSSVPNTQSFLTGSQAAVVFNDNDYNIDLGSSLPISGWQINSTVSDSVITDNNYDKFRTRITNQITPKTTFDLSDLDSSTYCSALETECYFMSTGSTAISLPAQTINGKKIILLVDGDGVTGSVNITGNIDITGNGLLVILARTNITVDGNVTALKGIYLAQNTFDTGTSLTNRLTVTGSVIGLGTVTLTGRTYQSSTTPALQFVYSPEYISALPKIIFEQNRQSEELAP